jgi:phosphoribosylanthranilate isomerase
MNPKPFIKASAITNLSDARYFASYGVAMMGFCFDPKSVDFINPFKMREISGWVEGPKLAGEFDHLSVEAMIEAIQAEQLDYAQVKLKSITKEHSALDIVPLILEIEITAETDFAAAENFLSQVYTADDYVLLNSLYITDKQLEETPFRNFIKSICTKYPTILQHHFTATNALGIIDAFHPAGVSLKGGSEIKTGTKLFEATDALMEVLQQEL